MNFDPKTANFATGFTPENMVVVGTKTNRGEQVPVVVYNNTFKGKVYFHVRELWFDEKTETWNIGKGLSLPGDSAAAVFAAIGKLATPVAAPAPKAAARKVKVA